MLPYGGMLLRNCVDFRKKNDLFFVGGAHNVIFNIAGLLFLLFVFFFLQPRLQP